MCGIAGVYHQNGDPVPSDLIRRMTDAVAHRGPDGEGQYLEGPVGLGHRRLAIIDLSPAGHQPMSDIQSAGIIVYNGEIYNFQELRVELEALGHQFHSRTDTEVCLHAYLQWGEDCVKRFNGMFAFAIWDRRKKQLFLARDRYGVKPLYWYHRGDLFVFASEIKAILKHPKVSPSLSPAALNEYMTFQNILSDQTLFEGIRLLPPGCTMTLGVNERKSGPKILKYWDFVPTGGSGSQSEGECTDRLHHLFVEAVTRQLISDVPVGAYLSGGIDSGSITSVAARSLNRLCTFTGGFDLSSASGLELGFDERAAAEVLSNQIGTEHYEVVLHAGDMENVLSRLVWQLEDLRVGQCYPNYYVARLASKFVKVVLSGAGGDELFGGYPWRYFHGTGRFGKEEYCKGYYEFWQRLVPDEDKKRLFAPALFKEIDERSSFDSFRKVFASWPGSFDNNEDYVNASLYFEFKTFLHGLLVVEDKLSMAHSLETRVPFLDNEIVDYAVTIPARFKLRDLEHGSRVDENTPGKLFRHRAERSDGKQILRKAMSQIVPPEILERTKQGFSAPDASWFRGRSIDYINRLLRDPKARIFEFFDPAYVGDVLEQHCSGKVNRRLLIWSFLSLEWWCRNFLDNPGASAPALERVRP